MQSDKPHLILVAAGFNPTVRYPLTCSGVGEQMLLLRNAPD
jgi:hypothetical protein